MYLLIVLTTFSPENIVGCGLYSLLDDYVQVLC